MKINILSFVYSLFLFRYRHNTNLFKIKVSFTNQRCKSVSFLYFILYFHYKFVFYSLTRQLFLLVIKVIQLKNYYNRACMFTFLIVLSHKIYIELNEIPLRNINYNFLIF